MFSHWELTLDDGVLLLLSASSGCRVYLGELSAKGMISEHRASCSIVVAKSHNSKARFDPYCQA